MDAKGTLSLAADPWAIPTTLATVTTATTTLSPWPSWPADAASNAVAAKVSVTEGQRYWLKLSCPTPTDTSHLQNGGPGKGCAVGARFHAAEAHYAQLTTYYSLLTPHSSRLTTPCSPGEDVVVGDHLSMLRTFHP